MFPKNTQSTFSLFYLFLNIYVVLLMVGKFELKPLLHYTYHGQLRHK